MTTTSLTLPVRTLHDLLRPVLPCAANDDMMPSISSVFVERRGDYLVAEATNRFQVGICRQLLPPPADDNVPGPFSALIALDNAKHLLGLFKPVRGQEATITLTVDDDGDLVAESGGDLGISVSELRVRYHLVTGQFPNLASLVGEAFEALTDAPPQRPAFSLNPTYLMAFRHAILDRDDYLVVVPPPEKKGAREALIVRVGDHFLGLLMPRREGEQSLAASSIGDWAGSLGSVTSKKPKKVTAA